MDELLNNDKNERYTSPCSPLYISFIYFIMINRIGRGYSAKELSFLLGKDDDFIENLELLKTVDFSIELYGYLSRIFNHVHFIYQHYSRDTELKYEMTRWQADNTIFYRMESAVNEHESVVCFQLSEEHPSCKDRYARSVDNAIENCQKALYMMMEEGIFSKPVSASAIYRYLTDTLETSIDPRHLKKELDKLWGRKGKAPLKRTKRKSYGYRYVLHPDIDIDKALDFVNQKFDKL